jgi:Domain of unknown function (DUF4129)
MDGNAPRRGGSVGRTLAVAAGIVALVAVVAIASTGSVPTGTGGSGRRPSESFLDAAISIFLLLMVVGGALVAVMLSFFGRYEIGSGPPRRRNPVRSLVSILVTIGLVVLFAHFVTGSRDGEGPRLPGLDGADGTPGEAGANASYDPQFAVWPVVVVVALVAVAVLSAWLSMRARRAASEVVAVTRVEALADVLAETLDDLRSEQDPRRAVIGAYARMERALAACGLPRRDAEAPEEYLDRVLDAVELSRSAATRLTALFAWARFSVHDVRPDMKDEAIETLEKVHEELAAAEALRQARLAGVPV